MTEDEEKTLTQRVIDTIREAERAKIVAWLRSPSAGPGGGSSVAWTSALAACIERGDHTEGEP